MIRVGRKLYMLLSVAVSILYFWYRFKYTLNLSSPYATFASVMLLAAEGWGCFLFWLYFFQVWDLREPDPPPDPPEGWTVDVFVPTYNEDVQLLRQTILACVEMEYPHQTYVLDDGKRPAVAELARELGVKYITRSNNVHAKAGNLNNALAQTDGQFVVIFDADHVPSRRFLTRLLGYFRDEKLGFIQTPHAFYNFDSYQASTSFRKGKYWEEGQLFYNVIQLGKNYWNAVVFAGSAAMFRRRALEDVGFIAVETITEDLHTGMRVVSKGWKSLFVPERLIAGQAPSDVTTFHSQRLRWGEGNLSVLAYDNPLTMRGLNLAQRISYFASIIGWTSGLAKLGIYLTPIMLLFTDVPPVSQFTWTLFWVTLVYLFVTNLAVKIVSKGYGYIIDIELSNMATFFTQIRALYRAVFKRRRQKFVVTAKRGRQSKSILPLIAPHLALVTLSVLALFWAGVRLYLRVTDDSIAESVAAALVAFHLILDYSILRRALQIENRRFNYRHWACVPVRYTLEGADGEILFGYGLTADLSESGIRLISYAPLPLKATGTFILSASGIEVECKGNILYGVDAPVSLNPGETCHRYGVQFIDVRPEQCDRLSYIAMQYAVPSTYKFFERKPRWYTRLWMRQQRTWKRSHDRFPYRLPTLIGGHEPVNFREATVTEDFSSVAFRAVLQKELTDNADVHFLMPTPIGEIAGTARVLRRDAAHETGGMGRAYVFEFSKFYGASRATLVRFFAADVRRQIEAILKPTPTLMPSKNLKPALACVAVVLFCAPIEFSAFYWKHYDELKLRHYARAHTLTPDDVKQINAIYENVVDDRIPETMNLIYLRMLMQRTDQSAKAVSATRLLVQRNPGNLGLRLGLADSLSNAGEYAAAEKEFDELIKLMDKSTASIGERFQILLSAARNAHKFGNLELSIQRFERLTKLGAPISADIRNEFAGILSSAGKYEEAVALFRGEPLDQGSRIVLGAIEGSQHEFSAARQQYQAVLQVDPNNSLAMRRLAEILTAEKKYAEAQKYYEQLLKRDPSDIQVKIHIAELSLWSLDYAEAVRRYSELLKEHLDRRELQNGFIDAAASAANLDADTRSLALELYQRLIANPAADPIQLGRLSWVLERMNEGAASLDLLQRAVALRPNDRDLRLQLANRLQKLGRFQEAEEQYNRLLQASPAINTAK